MPKITCALLACLLIFSGCNKMELPPSFAESLFEWEIEPEIEPPTEPGEPESDEESEPLTPQESSEKSEESIEIPLAEPENHVTLEPFSTPPPQSSGSVERFDAAKIGRELLRLINAEREAAGFEALGEQEEMRFAAEIRSAEVLASLSHTRPDGSAYYTAFDEAGFVYAGRVHGENIAMLHFSPGIYDEISAAAEMFANLKSSPGHYQNMINGDFLHAGVGASASWDGELWNIGSVQLFASR